MNERPGPPPVVASAPRNAVDLVSVIFMVWKRLGPGLGDEYDELYIVDGGEAGGA